MDSTYLRAVTSSALQGLLTAAWIAAGELPVAQRRLGRVGAVVGLSALASIGDREEQPAETTTEAKVVTKRQMVATVVTVGGAVGMIVGRRQLEKRWLRALARNGHPHPHRALALRMGLLSFAGTVPARIVRVHEARRSKGV